MQKTVSSQDYYLTIENEQRSELKVRGSAFIATVTPIQSKSEASVHLERIRKEFFDATHNCYAYRLGHSGLEFRTSDDGEPNGTAGKPILFVMQKNGISDILLVVTRYFGGTKLGTGGLARAYTDSAESVLQMVEKKIVYKTIPIRVFCTYEDVTVVKKIIESYAISYDGDYRDAIEFIAQVPISSSEIFITEINTKTHGRGGCVVVTD